MKKVSLYAVGILLMCALTSQCQSIDSLISALPKARAVDRGHLLLDIAYEYASAGDRTNFLDYARNGYAVAQSARDTSGMIRAARMLGQAYRMTNDLEASLKIYKEILPFIEHSKNDSLLNNGYIDIIFGMALTHTYRAEYDEALRLHLICLDNYRRLNNRDDESLTLNNIGLVYYKLKDYEKALRYFAEASEMMNNDDVNMTTTKINMALCFAYLGDYVAARKVASEVLNGCSTTCEARVVTEACFALGVANFYSGRLHMAESYFLRSYSTALETNDVRFQFDNIDYLTRIFVALNRVDSANALLNRAEGILKKGTSFNLESIKLYRRLFEAYHAISNHEMAAFYQLKFISLKDSIYGETLTTNLMKVEAEFLERENRLKLTSQAELLRLNGEVIWRGQALNVVVALFVLLLGAFVVALWRRLTEKKRISQLLEKRARERTLELESSRSRLLDECHKFDQELYDAKTHLRNSLSILEGIHASNGDQAANQLLYYVKQLISQTVTGY